MPISCGVSQLVDTVAEISSQLPTGAYLPCKGPSTCEPACSLGKEGQFLIIGACQLQLIYGTMYLAMFGLSLGSRCVTDLLMLGAGKHYLIELLL